jgi:hypothetical protein
MFLLLHLSPPKKKKKKKKPIRVAAPEATKVMLYRIRGCGMKKVQCIFYLPDNCESFEHGRHDVSLSLLDRS